MESANVLIVGSGGREHAIALALSKSPYNPKIFCYGTNKNPGIFSLVNDPQHFRISDNYNCDSIVDFAKANYITYVVIGPEKLLKMGLTDQLRKELIAVIGPSEALAKIETSKIFTRGLLTSCGLSKYNPEYCIFNPDDDISMPLEYIKSLGSSYVIKANGLHGGKGVKISPDQLPTLSDSIKYLFELNEREESYLIEQRLYGDEFSIISFCDGRSYKHMPPCMDFKLRDPKNTGPMTGGMGSITYANHLLPFLIPADLDDAHYVIETAINHLMERYDESYCGIVYGSFMKTREGDIKLIEFNARFGDSECINLLHILKTDLHFVFMNMLGTTLDRVKLDLENRATVFKYLVPPNYPEKQSNICTFKIKPGSKVSSHIYAGMELVGETYFSTGSRTMGVIADGSSLKDANTECEREIILFLDTYFYHRYDIGDEYSINSYKSSGVDVEKMDNAVLSIKKSVENTQTPAVLSKWGDYAGIFSLNQLLSQLNETPYLVSSVDGVGTKNIFTKEYLGYEGDTVCGRDIVNHCINDILVKGAKPLFFLDYYAGSTVDPESLKHYVKGISQSCMEYGVSILGGETAEMPTVYNEGHSDMVGMIVGYLTESMLIDGKRDIRDGDVIYGLSSSGPHTNGYSLVRKIIGNCKYRIANSDIKNLVQSHRCYYNEIQLLRDGGVKINGLVHITGGGYKGNVGRVLTDELGAVFKTWVFPEPFNTLQREGNISTEEMLDTFNCGYGMLVIVNEKELEKMVKILGEGAVLGRIVKRGISKAVRFY